jgi:GT2 family glycosyltransferase
VSAGNGATLVAYLHPNKVSHNFSDSLMRLVAYDAAHSGRVIATGGPVMMRCGTGGLIEARNQVMTTFLDGTSAEWLFMVDADMGFAPDTVERLVEAADPVERPVVGALCFALREVMTDGLQGFKVRPLPTLYGWAQKPDGESGFTVQRRYPKDSVVRVAGTGAACLLVHRTAAEKVRAQSGDRFFDRVEYASGKAVSEDLSFCYRLAKADVPIHVHTGVKTNHHKEFWVGEEEYELFESAFRANAAASRVSVLLPSRGRPDSLRASVESLRKRASFPELLEILVGADPDDDATHATCADLGVTALVASQRYGYSELHRYFNELAEAATGEWLLLWNDDATMLTDRWDEVLAAVPANVLVADLQSQHSPRLVCFPAVRQRAVEAVGGFSPHTPHADTYWQQIGRATGRMAAVPIQVFHDRDDITGGHQDQTRAEGKAGYRPDEFFSPPVQTAIKEDTGKVRDLP